mmetsp:Transcript_114713/g.180610  ORF Transcript_114713/g.180610 Transcript_114713/m.180610 type:complete len:164 (+) Transcript_114713:64-555(+)
MAGAPLRLPVSASKGLLLEALTPRRLGALTPGSSRSAVSFASCHDALTPKTPLSCYSPAMSSHTPRSASGSAAVRRLAMCSFPAEVDTEDHAGCSSTDSSIGADIGLPCLLGRTLSVGTPAPVVDSSAKFQRHVHFDESELDFATNARDAFLARQRRIRSREP